MFQKATTFFVLHETAVSMLYGQFTRGNSCRNRVACDSCGEKLYRINGPLR